MTEQAGPRRKAKGTGQGTPCPVVAGREAVNPPSKAANPPSEAVNPPFEAVNPPSEWLCSGERL
eukprot:6099014-Pyramimonas_sp.AAC.1